MMDVGVGAIGREMARDGQGKGSEQRREREKTHWSHRMNGVKCMLRNPSHQITSRKDKNEGKRLKVGRRRDAKKGRSARTKS